MLRSIDDGKVLKMHKALNLLIVFMFVTTPLVSAVGTVGPVKTAVLDNSSLGPVVTSRGETAPTGYVDVTAENTLNLARQKEVMRLSVPLGIDELRDLNKVKIINNDTQAEMLGGVLPSTVEYYPNRSIHRMDVTWQDDFAAKAIKHYRILVGQGPTNAPTNLTASTSSTGATVRDGSKTYTIAGDASGQNPAYVRCQNSKGEALSYFLVQMGGNQFTNDQVSFTILWGRPTLITADSNAVMATVHLKYEKPSIVYWNGPVKIDVDLVSADVIINFFHGRSMVEFKVHKYISERLINHNGFVDEFTALNAGNDDYNIEFGNSDHLMMSGNTSSYTIAENTTTFKNITSSWRSAPAFADWDADGDMDLVLGDENGTLTGYKNIGNKTVANFTKDAAIFNGIDVGTYSVPEFADVNGDGLMDLVLGRGDGTLAYYRNVGTATVPAWTLDNSVFSGIDAGTFSAPALDDINGDGKLDLIIGEKNGGIVFYKNTGTTSVPVWTLDTATFNYMNTGASKKPDTYSDPDFADVNWDGKTDFISGVEHSFWMGYVMYLNTGTGSSPKYTDINDRLLDQVRMYSDLGNYTHPEWVDLNHDGNPDLVVGRADGTLKYWQFVGNTTPERKSDTMVRLLNGTYRYFTSLAGNEGWYTIVKEDPIWKDYYLVNSPKAKRTVMRFNPDFKRLTYGDTYYADAYPWAGYNSSYYPTLPPGQDGQVSRGQIDFQPYAGGANAATFFTQTGMGNGFIMSGPTAAMDFYSHEVMMDDLTYGQPASYYDNLSMVLATPLKITSPIDLSANSASIAITPNKGDGQSVPVYANLTNLGGASASNIKFEFYGDDITPSNLLCSGTITTVPGFGGANASCQWDLTGWGGVRKVFLVVDPKNTSKELDEFNNIVNNTITVPFVSWTLSPIAQVSNNVGTNNSMAVDLTVDSNGKPWATWETYRTKENWDIGVSSFDGSSWAPVTWVYQGHLYSADPSISSGTNGKLMLSFGNNEREHIQYVQTRSPKYYWNTRQELFVAKFDGTSWAAPSRVTSASIYNDSDQASDITILSNGSALLTIRNTKFMLYDTPGVQIDNQPYSDLNIMARFYNQATQTWSGNITIDNSPGEQGWWNGPQVSTNNGHTWMAWDTEAAGQWGIKAVTYNASGFGALMTLPVPTDGNGMRPSIAAASDGTAWATYESKIGDNTSIFATHYDGASWSTPTKISDDAGREIKASVALDVLGNPWVAWESNRDGNKNIYVRHFNGLFWSEYIQVTDSAVPDEQPKMVAGPAGTMWVAWESDMNGHGQREIFARKISYSQDVPTIKTTTITPNPAFEDQNITFSGTASVTAGKVARYDWDFNGDGIYDWSSSQGGVATWSYPQAGTYKARFRVVSDSDLAVESNLLTVKVINKAPVAVAGKDRFVAEDTVVTFNGNGSYDTPSDMALGLEYKWDFGDKNITQWSHNWSARHTYTAYGFYNVSLSVRDDDLNVSTDTLNVTVYNLMPVVNITIGNLTGTEDEILTFKGHANDTPSDQATVQWRWVFGDGNFSAWSRDISASHAYAQQGIYKAMLIARDKDNMTDNASISVNITNLPPEVFQALAPDDVVQEDTAAVFTGTGTDTASDLPLLKYYWDFGDGNNSGWINATEVSHNYTTAGDHAVKFTVKDDDGAEASTDLTVTVVNPAPVATILNMASTVKEDSALLFNGTGTDTVSDQQTLNYTWDFGDGNNATGKVSLHTYTKVKTYTATLTVRDDEGLTGAATTQITVTNVNPIAKANASKTSVKTSEVITFSSAGSNDTPSDLDGLTFLWTFGDGASSTLKNPTHSYTTGGNKPVKLTVTDEHGASATATLTITVQATACSNCGTEDKGTNMALVAGAIVGIVAVILVVLLVLFMRKKAETTPKPKPKTVKADEEEEAAETAALSKPTKKLKKAKPEEEETPSKDASKEEAEKEEKEKPSKDDAKEKDDGDEDISDDEPGSATKDAPKTPEAPNAAKDEKK